MNEVKESLHAWSKEAYENAARANQGAGGEGGGAGAGPGPEGFQGGGAQGDPNVVDAEFEKVDDKK